MTDFVATLLLLGLLLIVAALAVMLIADAVVAHLFEDGRWP